MRRFSSYGPILTSSNYYIPRTELIEQTLHQLVGEKPEETGHYITIWAPRQRGKTWVLQQVMRRIRNDDAYANFDVAKVNLQTPLDSDDPVVPASYIISDLSHRLKCDFPPPKTMKEFKTCFTRNYLDKPLILILDEFDSLSHNIISAMIKSFRNVHIQRRDDTSTLSAEKEYLLHGVALIGVQGVLGEGNPTSPPFNVQRSVNIPNLTYDEVTEMYQWYAQESGQPVEKSLIDRVYYETTGQPGLVSWFGELVTEQFNRTPDQPLTADDFDWMFVEALNALPNANLLNIVSKANMPEHKPFVLELFQTSSKVPFKYGDPTQTFLYLNGVIDYERDGQMTYVKFANPFVQKRLFNAYYSELFGVVGPMHEPFEDLTDTITESTLNVRNLLGRYQTYLDKNRDWLLKDVPRRIRDNRIYEATFHFSLYAYLERLLYSYRGHISPEFPTGNGQIDLVINHASSVYGIELKSFTNMGEYQIAIGQAARYATTLQVTEIWLGVFVDSIDDENRSRLEAPQLDANTGVTVHPVFIITQQNTL